MHNSHLNGAPFPFYGWYRSKNVPASFCREQFHDCGSLSAVISISGYSAYQSYCKSWVCACARVAGCRLTSCKACQLPRVLYTCVAAGMYIVSRTYISGFHCSHIQHCGVYILTRAWVKITFHLLWYSVMNKRWTISSSVACRPYDPWKSLLYSSITTPAALPVLPILPHAILC